MGFLKKLAIGGVILSIILAAMLYHPLHEDITDRNTTRIIMAIWKVSKYIVSIYCLLMRVKYYITITGSVSLPYPMNLCYYCDATIPGEPVRK